MIEGKPHSLCVVARVHCFEGVDWGEEFYNQKKGCNWERMAHSLFDLVQTVGSFEVKCCQVVTPYLLLSHLGISGLETGGHRERGHVKLGREIGNSWELTPFILGETMTEADKSTSENVTLKICSGHPKGIPNMTSLPSHIYCILKRFTNEGGESSTMEGVTGLTENTKSVGVGQSGLP